MATANDLTISLRIKASLDEARQAVHQVRTEIKGLADDGSKAAKAIDAIDTAGAKATGGAKSAAGASNASAATSNPSPAVAAATAAVNEDTPAVVSNTKAKKDNKKATDDLGDAHSNAAPKVKNAKKAVDEYGVSIGQTKAAMRQLPAQITDIVTGLQGGQKPLTVLIQQGGQIKDSFGGILPALRAMTGLLTLQRVGIGSVLLVLAGLAVAWRNATERQNEFTKATILSGNAAGVTSDQYKKESEELGKRLGGAQRQSADVMQQLITTGKVGAEGLSLITEAAIRLERAGGDSAEKTVQMFAELGKEPLQAALKYDQALNVLTPSVIRQLTELEKQRRYEEAAALAQSTYANALIARSKKIDQSLDTSSKAWNALKNAAKGAIDAVVSAFDKAPIEKQIEAATKSVAHLKTEIAYRKSIGQPLDDLPDILGRKENHLQDLREDVEETKRLAKADAEAAAQKERYKKAFADTDALLTKGLPKQEQYLKKLKEYDRDIAERQKGGDNLTAKQIAAGRKAIRDEIYGDGYDFREDSAKAGIALARIKADLSVLQGALQSQDAIIEQGLKEGTTSIERAYADRLAILTKEGEAQLAAIQAEIAQTDKALKRAKNEQERAPLTQKKIELQAQVKLLDQSLQEGQRKLQIWKSEQERDLATITAKVRVEVAGIKGGFDRKAVEDQLRLQMEPEIQKTVGIGDPAERAAAVERIGLIMRAGVAQAEFTAKLAEAQRLQDQMAVKEGAIQAQQQQGYISQTEAEAKLRALRAQQVPQLLEIAGQMEAIRESLPVEARAVFDDFSAAIGRLRNQATADTPAIVSAGTRMRNAAIDGLADAAATAVTNFSNLRQTIAGTLKQIAGDIVRSNIKKYLTDQFTPGGGGGGGGGGGLISAGINFVKGLFGFAQGGKVQRLAEGGRISGPGTGTSDSIPALVGGRKPIAVSNGEWIQPVRAVKHYGTQFMEQVRTLRLPRPGFAFGGLVRSYEKVRFATGGQVTTAGADAGGGINMRVELVNTGTPQKLVRQSSQIEGKDVVMKVVLQDLRDGGPISQAVGNVRGRN